MLVYVPIWPNLTSLLRQTVEIYLGNRAVQAKAFAIFFVVTIETKSRKLVDEDWLANLNDHIVLNQAVGFILRDILAIRQSMLSSTPVEQRRQHMREIQTYIMRMRVDTSNKPFPRSSSLSTDCLQSNGPIPWLD